VLKEKKDVRKRFNGERVGVQGCQGEKGCHGDDSRPGERGPKEKNLIKEIRAIKNPGERGLPEKREIRCHGDDGKSGEKGPTRATRTNWRRRGCPGEQGCPGPHGEKRLYWRTRSEVICKRRRR
jgi:hypothetical protein